MIYSGWVWKVRFRCICSWAGMVAAFVILATGCQELGYVGTETCLACHNGELAKDRTAFLESQHVDVGCEACHGPGALHVRNGGRYGLLIDSAEGDGESLCKKCHEEKVAEFQESGHAMKGVLGCLDCHDPHSGDETVRTFEDNQLCLQCHTYSGFETEEAVSAHTFHTYDPEGTGASRCVACHMVPTDRVDQENTHNHSLVPVPPEASNLSEIVPVPPNSCSGIIGCHDGSISTVPNFDVDDPATNDFLQNIYDARYGL